MPHFPTHPPFLFGLTKKHGDFVGPNGMSSAADSIAFGGHCGTHIDALNHFSCGGKLFGNVNASGVQSYDGGVSHNAIESVEPILRRAVLLDIAGLEKTSALAREFRITPDHLDRACRRQQVQVNCGDIVLLRTGWAQFFGDQTRYVSETNCPGPELAAAQWLSSHGVFAAGSDTLGFEKTPSAEMPVHVHLLFESGIHIMENLQLEDVARDGVFEFLFIAAPLKIRGGTGGPIRPIALTPK